MNGERGAGRDVDEVAGQDDGRSVSLETMLARKTPPRWRVVRLALLLVVVVGVVGGLLLRQSILHRPATPRATHGPYVAALIQSDVSWGTLALNGERLGVLPQAITLDGTDNVLTLAAPPFATQTCHLSAAMINHGTPSVASTAGPACTVSMGSAPDSSAPPTALVSVLLGGANLPDDLRAAARAAVTAALSTFREQTTVPTGEYYATGRDTQGRPLSQRATAPLTATLDVVAAPRPHASYPACGDPYCGIALSAQPGGQVWVVAVDVALRWRFTDASGAQVGEATFPVAHPLSLNLLYDGHGWQPEGEPSVPAGIFLTEMRLVCPVGIDLLSGYQQGNDIGVAGIGEEPQSCAFQLRDLTGAKLGLVIWRFGVLLAGDAAAHQLLPALPLAPATEIAAAGGARV